MVCREWNPRATSSGFLLNSNTASTSAAGGFFSSSTSSSAVRVRPRRISVRRPVVPSPSCGIVSTNALSRFTRTKTQSSSPECSPRVTFLSNSKPAPLSDDASAPMEPPKSRPSVPPVGSSRSIAITTSAHVFS